MSPRGPRHRGSVFDATCCALEPLPSLTLELPADMRVAEVAGAAAIGASLVLVILAIVLLLASGGGRRRPQRRR